jgi:two-component system CheB/CheR fusion protein
MLSLRDIGVLVVDDSEDTVVMLQQLLELNGATVYTARSGSEALQVANQHQFDIVLSDVAMPEMDGFEFLRKLRELPAHHDVPVLALTGFGRPEDVERAKQAGFFSHITKPFDLEKLATTLRSIPRKERDGDGSPQPHN